MRPTKEHQNRLVHPLNEIFGTQANVRLLRVLALQNTSLTAGELAKRAMLGRTSIYPALHELECVAVIEFIGAGPRKLVQLRGNYPLSQILKKLFRVEAGRFDELTTALRKLISGMSRGPISTWIDRGGEDPESAETLTLYVVAPPEELNGLTDYLNERLADLERKHDVHIAVHGIMPSELEALYRTHLTMLEAAVLLGGVPPVALLERSRSTAKTSRIASHDEHEARSRRLAVATAAKIRSDPALITMAEERVRHRAGEASPGERRELAEWIRILSTMSPARLRRFLRENMRTRHSLAANTACLESPIAGRTGRGYAQSDGCRSIRCCGSSMTRLELEHAIRGSSDVAGDDEVYVFGSQAILGQYPDAPESLRQSAETDIAPVKAMDGLDRIDGNLGELSAFHGTFGFYCARRAD